MSHLIVDRFGSLFAVVALFTRKRRAQKLRTALRAVGEVPEPIAHAETRHHLANQLGGALQVIGRTRRYDALVDDLFSRASSQHDGDLIFQLRPGHEVSFLGWQLQRVAQCANRARNDGHTVNRIGVLDR